MNLSVSSFPATPPSPKRNREKATARIAGWLANVPSTSSRKSDERSRVPSYQPARPIIHIPNSPLPGSSTDTQFPKTPIAKDVSTKDTIRSLGLVDTVESQNLRRLVTHRPPLPNAHMYAMPPKQLEAALKVSPLTDTDTSIQSANISTPATSIDLCSVEDTSSKDAPLVEASAIAPTICKDTSSIAPVQVDSDVPQPLADKSGAVESSSLAVPFRPILKASGSQATMKSGMTSLSNHSSTSIGGRGRRAMPPVPLVLKSSSHKRRSRSVPNIKSVPLIENHARAGPLIIKARPRGAHDKTKPLMTRKKSNRPATSPGPPKSKVTVPEIPKLQIKAKIDAIAPPLSPRPLPSPPMPAVVVPESNIPALVRAATVATTTTEQRKRSLPAIPQGQSSARSSLISTLQVPQRRPSRPLPQSPTSIAYLDHREAPRPIAETRPSVDREWSDPVSEDNLRIDREMFYTRGQETPLIDSSVFASWDFNDLRPLSFIPYVNLSSTSLGEPRGNEEHGSSHTKAMLSTLKGWTKLR